MLESTSTLVGVAGLQKVNLVMLDDPGRVRSQNASVVCQIQLIPPTFAVKTSIGPRAGTALVRSGI